MTLDCALWLAIAAGVVAILYGVVSVRWILAQPAGNSRMQEIAAAIQAGAKAYLNRQYSTIAFVGAILFVVLGVTLGWGYRRRLRGGRRSLRPCRLHRHVHLRARQCGAPRKAAHSGINSALKVAFRGGAITGMLVVGLGLLGVAGLLPRHAAYSRRCGSRIALAGRARLRRLAHLHIPRLGGGIFTKGADVGADLVGKVEAGIPEDDPRNPAVICGQRRRQRRRLRRIAADLFETYAVPWWPPCCWAD